MCQAATCPWMIQLGGRQLLLLVPPRMIQSGASGLISLGVAVLRLGVLFLVLPQLPQSRALQGLVTASLHHHGLLQFSTSLHR